MALIATNDIDTAIFVVGRFDSCNSYGRRQKTDRKGKDGDWERKWRKKRICWDVRWKIGER